MYEFTLDTMMKISKNNLKISLQQSAHSIHAHNW